jgi:GcrA cell cycle regulator
MEWTEESIRLLTAFWADGLSTAEIGRRLGVSKNAVVGKAHRLELTARPSPIHWDGPPRQRSKPRPGTPPRLTGGTLPPLESTAPGSQPAGEHAASGPPAAVFAARTAAATDRPVGATARPDAAPTVALRPSAPGSASTSGAADRAVPADAKRAAAAVAASPPAVPDPAPASSPESASRAALKPVPETPPARTTAGSTRAALQAVASRPFGRVVTCCWPIGEPGTRDFHFCDGRSVPGKPYCEEHAALAYVKVRDRREDAA